MKNIKEKVSKAFNPKVLAITGWLVIYSAILIGGSLYMGWNFRTSFDQTIKSEVITQVKSFTSE